MSLILSCKLIEIVAMICADLCCLIAKWICKIDRSWQICNQHVTYAELSCKLLDFCNDLCRFVLFYYETNLQKKKLANLQSSFDAQMLKSLQLQGLRPWPRQGALHLCTRAMSRDRTDAISTHYAWQAADCNKCDGWRLCVEFADNILSFQTADFTTKRNWSRFFCSLITLLWYGKCNP